MAIKTFKRIEKKYVVNEYQKRQIIDEVLKHMEFDKFCKDEATYKIQNIYYDTDNNTLISKSLMKPKYKAKVRVRHYINTDFYFLEWKQKTNGIVSKRRVTLSKKEYEDFLSKGIKPTRTSYLDKQIIDEFAYSFSKCQLYPKAYISYDRLAFFDKEDKEFRLTFDSNIRGSRTDFTWDKNKADIVLLKAGYVLEIKLNRNFPLWLVDTLSRLRIYPKSFSKYGEEYKIYIKERVNELI